MVELGAPHLPARAQSMIAGAPIVETVQEILSQTIQLLAVEQKVDSVLLGRGAGLIPCTCARP